MSIKREDSEIKALSSELAMGGQAVVEGVMMRGPKRVAVAVRAPAGDIRVMAYDYVPIARRIRILAIPVIRGAVGLVEALKIGIDALNWSAEQSVSSDSVKEKARPKFLDRLAMFATITFALAMGLGLFMYFPYFVARLSVGGNQGQVAFHLIAGGVRVTVLLGYLWVISLWKDIRRVFQYHGSEHKTIVAFETRSELQPSIISRQTRFHPRCGTSFLLIVALLSVVFFAVVDSFVVAFFGPYKNVLVRLLCHLPLIPLLAGLSFELLKFSARHTENALVKVLIQPGLWLQRITTKEPDEGMCEVAATALKEALGGESMVASPVLALEAQAQPI